MTQDIETAINTLVIWDADDHMDVDYVQSSPLYILLDKITSFDIEVLSFLLYNISQRVIPSWEFNCQDQQLRPALFALKKHLQQPLSTDNLKNFTTKIESPIFDCRYSDTSGASDTLYNSIMAIIEHSALFATYAVSSAEIANTGTAFEKWFKEVAISVSFEKKICNYKQTTMFTYDMYEDIYKDLFDKLQTI